MKKKLLIITQAQFGSLTDYYQYTLNLKEKFDIEFICWDYDGVKILVDGVNVIYVSRRGNLFKRNLLFLRVICQNIVLNTYDRILVNYFRGCFLLPLILSNNSIFYLDIRTAGVQPSVIIRFVYNTFLRFECLFFKNLSVISIGIKKKLRLSENTFILPLGANMVNQKRPIREGLHLLYIGTLNNRNIHQTLEGISLFLNKNCNVNLSYTIIGSGDKIVIEKLNKTIEDFQLKFYVKMLGYLPFEELEKFLQECNVGISYIPITNYYNFQPATKTFEYLMSGLPVIATSTFENKLIINHSNGVIIDDNPISFCKGLSEIYELLPYFNGDSIKEEFKDYQWEIISNKLEKYLS